MPSKSDRNLTVGCAMFWIALFVISSIVEWVKNNIESVLITIGLVIIGCVIYIYAKKQHRRNLLLEEFEIGGHKFEKYEDRIVIDNVLEITHIEHENAFNESTEYVWSSDETWGDDTGEIFKISARLDLQTYSLNKNNINISGKRYYLILIFDEVILFETEIDKECFDIISQMMSVSSDEIKYAADDYPCYRDDDLSLSIYFYKNEWYFSSIDFEMEDFIALIEATHLKEAQNREFNQIIPLQCPNCGGNIEIGKNATQYKCPYCGMEHLVR